MDGSKKTTVKLSRKIDWRGVYTEYLQRLILFSIHTCYNSSILPRILKENFQNQCNGSFISFHIIAEVD